MTNRSGFYVASRASIPARGQMWRELRASGVPITSSWIDEDGDGQTSDFAALWSRIELEIKSSLALVLYVEPQDLPLKGALVECGMAIAFGVPVRVVAPSIAFDARSFRPIGSWLKHPLVTFHDTVREAIEITVFTRTRKLITKVEQDNSDLRDRIHELNAEVERWKAFASLQTTALDLALDGEVH